MIDRQSKKIALATDACPNEQHPQHNRLRRKLMQTLPFLSLELQSAKHQMDEALAGSPSP
jgi:hypothetical protein